MAKFNPSHASQLTFSNPQPSQLLARDPYASQTSKPPLSIPTCPLLSLKHRHPYHHHTTFVYPPQSPSSIPTTHHIQPLTPALLTQNHLPYISALYGPIPHAFPLPSPPQPHHRSHPRLATPTPSEIHNDKVSRGSAVFRASRAAYSKFGRKRAPACGRKALE